MIPGTQWDDDPYPTSLSSAAFVCFACALIWLVCWPLDLLSRPRKGLRPLRDRAETRVIVGEAGAQLARADVDQGLVDFALHRCGDAVHARSLGENNRKKP